MTTQTELTHTDIHASNGIPTHDSRVQAGEDGSRFRQRPLWSTLYPLTVLNFLYNKNKLFLDSSSLSSY
jgi:hypothetical protein